MKIVSEQVSTGNRNMAGREVSYVELTVEMDFSDGKPWFNVATGFFELNCTQFLHATENPADTIMALRVQTRRCAMREVARRLFNTWPLPKDSVVIPGNEAEELFP